MIHLDVTHEALKQLMVDRIARIYKASCIADEEGWMKELEHNYNVTKLLVNKQKVSSAGYFPWSQSYQYSKVTSGEVNTVGRNLLGNATGQQE